MSPLTKVFVALHVVLSLLASAAAVTYVSTVQNYRAVADASKGQVSSLQSQLATKESALKAAQTQQQMQVSQSNSQIDAANAALAKAQSDVQAAQAQAAAEAAKLLLAQTNISALTGAVQVAEKSTSALQDQVATLRQTGDTRLQRQADLDRANADLQSKLDVTERQRRNFQEQLVEARKQNGQLSSYIKDKNLNLDEAMAGAGGVGRGAPKVEGQIRSISMVGPVKYATISIGSDDAVRKGMTFNITSADGRFLGRMEIEAVDRNQAFGRITTGPRLNEVAQGNTVQTQS